MALDVKKRMNRRYKGIPFFLFLAIALSFTASMVCASISQSANSNPVTVSNVVTYVYSLGINVPTNLQNMNLGNSQAFTVTVTNNGNGTYSGSGTLDMSLIINGTAISGSESQFTINGLSTNPYPLGTINAGATSSFNVTWKPTQAGSGQVVHGTETP